MTYTLFVLPVAVLATLVALALRQWPAAGSRPGRLFRSGP
jgi:hypothetical protein